MLEHMARGLYYFQVHLLYASLIGLTAWILTSIPRGSATAKYWIWVATSLNFILPFGALVDRVWGSQLYWAAPLGIVGDVANRVSYSSAAIVLGTIWLGGATLMFTRLWLRLRAERREANLMNRESAHGRTGVVSVDGIPVRFAASRQIPTVNGVLHPHISLPDGIDRLLTQDELNAVLIHELAHARRRDNLIRLIHEVGACLLWFHPLVWIAGSRLGLYRELSCDESVIASAHGGDLVSALAKFANPESGFLLQASASSFLGHRLARLSLNNSKPAYFAANALLTVSFGVVILWGILGTVAHTACCFRH